MKYGPGDCPLCGDDAVSALVEAHRERFTCQNCGSFIITAAAKEMLATMLKPVRERLAKEAARIAFRKTLLIHVERIRSVRAVVAAEIDAG